MIQSDRELENSREKLRIRKEKHGTVRHEPCDDEVREAEPESLRELIDQFKEEIGCYEASASTRANRKESRTWIIEVRL